MLYNPDNKHISIPILQDTARSYLSLNLNKSGCKEKEPEEASSLSQVLYISEEIICVTQGTATCFSHLESKKGKEELSRSFSVFNIIYMKNNHSSQSTQVLGYFTQVTALLTLNINFWMHYDSSNFMA